MKRRSIDVLVYEHMFPHPKPTDPQCWSSFLQRNLIPEVRQETACFYGSLDTREAQYPGLDYSKPSHRMRLGRFTWHRRLFRAFNALRMTHSEIAGLTHWEGTRWAKERFEKEQNIVIRDTTGDHIKDWVEPELRRPEARPVPFLDGAGMGSLDDVEEDDEELEGADETDEDDNEDGDYGDDYSDPELERAMLNLNRPRAGISDEEYEYWLKEAAEADGISLPGHDLRRREHARFQQAEAHRILPRHLNSRILQAGQTLSFIPRAASTASPSSGSRTRLPSAVPLRAQQASHDALLRRASARTTQPAQY